MRALFNTFIPGNHDEFARQFLGHQFGGIEVAAEAVMYVMYVMYVNDFEDAVARAAQRAGHDGVVCGHIHRAEMRDINGVLYCNDGDWVESCSALVEHHDGRLEIVRWADQTGGTQGPEQVTGVSHKPAKLAFPSLGVTNDSFFSRHFCQI